MKELKNVILGLIIGLTLTSCMSVQQKIAWNNLKQAGENLNFKELPRCMAACTREVHNDFIHTEIMYKTRFQFHKWFNGCKDEKCIPFCYIDIDQGKYLAKHEVDSFNDKWEKLQHMEPYDPKETGEEFLDDINKILSRISKELIENITKYVDYELSGDLHLYHQFKLEIAARASIGWGKEEAYKMVMADWMEDEGTEKALKHLMSKLPEIQESTFFYGMKRSFISNIETLQKYLPILPVGMELFNKENKDMKTTVSNILAKMKDVTAYLKEQQKLRDDVNRAKENNNSAIIELGKVAWQLYKAYQVMLDLSEINTEEDKALQKKFDMIESIN